MIKHRTIQLNAPAGDLSSLMAAVDGGADSVYIGFRSPTNLRNLPGLNFSITQAAEAVKYAHNKNAKINVAVNTHPTDDQLDQCLRAIDDAVEINADAVIVADLAVLEYARNKYENLEIHISCSAGLADAAAIRFYKEQFDIACVVLPRVLSIDQIAQIRKQTDVLLEVMVFGVLCANYDGGCYLSSFITGSSAHSIGACSPAQFIKIEHAQTDRAVLKLNGIVINESVNPAQRTYPMPCKGRYRNHSGNRPTHTFQDPCCLNALPVLEELAQAGVDIVKVEGRQRSLAYIKSVTTLWRNAIDNLYRPLDAESAVAENMPLSTVLDGMEGMAETLGPLKKGALL